MELEQIAGVPTPVDEAEVQTELAAYLDGVELAREPWKIASLGQADWAMRKVAECRALAERYDDEVVLWQAARAKIVGAADWFEDRLKEWAIAQRTPSVKTLRTAHGTVATREGKAKIAVVDEDAAMEWARKCAPDAIKVTETFQISRLPDRIEIGTIVVAWAATSKTTGEVQRIPTVPLSMEVANERLPIVQAKMGDEFVVEIETQPAVVDASTGREVPGLGISDGRVTATVTPLGL